MGARPLVLLASGGLLVTALFAVQPLFDGAVVPPGTRIVQAPQPPPVAGAHTAHSAHTSDSAGPPELAGTNGTAVGFTVIGGRLYLVTARDAEAVTQYTEAVGQDGEPSWRCSPDTAPAPFTAWELRGRGGSGGLPPLDGEGRLLTAPPDGGRLACAVTGA